VRALSAAVSLPVLVVMRRPPDFAAIRRALFSDEPRGRPRVPGARRKWRLINDAGPVEPLEVVRPRGASPTGLGDGRQSLWVQRFALSAEAAQRLVASTTLHGQLPEPLRLAHLIAGGITTGKSRGRA